MYYNIIKLNKEDKDMTRGATIEERRQEWKDRYFNKYSNEATRKIILQKQNAELRKELALLEGK